MNDSQTIPAPPMNENDQRASKRDLLRQSAYFSSVLLTRNLLDAMPGMVLVLNRFRQIVFANRAFCDLAGHDDSRELLGKLVGDVMSCHVVHEVDFSCGTGAACETCGALTAMLSGLAGRENVQECSITRKMGQALQNLSLRLWSAPLRYAEEGFTVFAGTDISHERRRLALERTFFHDILNLVGSIRGFAELLQIDSGNDKAREVSRRIQLASQRVIDEIDAQRVLLAVEKGELKVDSHMLVSTQVLADAIELYEGQEIARNRTLIIDAAAHSTAFVSDATLLRRILGNMLKNALEASTEGDGVTLGADFDGCRLRLWVHNAALIPVQYQPRIFQRDFSTKGPGRGLGTYSMQLLGCLLSGEVTFVSEPDFGTRFFLDIPVSLPAGSGAGQN